MRRNESAVGRQAYAALGCGPDYVTQPAYRAPMARTRTVSDEQFDGGPSEPEPAPGAESPASPTGIDHI